MSNVALHMRITKTQVSDEDVDRRNQAVVDLATSYGKLKKIDQIFGKAAEIAAALNGNGEPSVQLGMEVEEAVQKYSSSFIYSERPLEVGICSGMAIHSIISQPPSTLTAFTNADLFAAALWSALSFQAPLEAPKREALRAQVLAAAQKRVTTAAESARIRTNVSDFGQFAIVVEELDKVPASFKKATSSTIEALRRNAALDREELDFLWWVMLDRSRLLKTQLLKLDEPVRLVVAGLEAASNLRKLPCDVHHELVLRSVSEDAELDLPSLLVCIGEDREKLMSAVESGYVDDAPHIFPLLNALSTGKSDIEGGSIARKASEWGSRALLEAGILHICSVTADSL